MQTKKITVIGAGVIGLTTAIVLQEVGYEVKIVTEKLPFGLNTTSNKAAAIWFPYNAEPRDKINQWSRESYDQFVNLCEEKESGVRMVESIYIAEDKNLWWIPAFREETVKDATPEQLPGEYNSGLIVDVPFIETPIYLKYLVNHFKDQGGVIEIKKLEKEDLRARCYENDLLINCVGLAAQQLFDDENLYPIQGYIVKVDAPQQTDYILRDEGELAYIIPRTDGVILGGTANENVNQLSPDDATVQAIVDRCVRLSPNLATANIIEKYIGLRPARKGGIRLGYDDQMPIIHNYGHGGSGFTVSWGCAYDVVQLIEEWE